MPEIGESYWINEPAFHENDHDVLVLRTGKETDWWNNTFYGFRHTSGHLLATRVTGDFTFDAKFTARYERLYDQAGVMLRVDDDNWLKCGAEFTDGALHFSVVVTRDNQSDWSVMPLAGAPDAPVTLRLTRHDEALRVQLLGPDGTWRLARLCYLRMPATVEVGPMACSPTGEGLEATFLQSSVGLPIERELHPS